MSLTQDSFICPITFRCFIREELEQKVRRFLRHRNLSVCQMWMQLLHQLMTCLLHSKKMARLAVLDNLVNLLFCGDITLLIAANVHQGCYHDNDLRSKGSEVTRMVWSCGWGISAVGRAWGGEFTNLAQDAGMVIRWGELFRRRQQKDQQGELSEAKGTCMQRMMKGICTGEYHWISLQQQETQQCVWVRCERDDLILPEQLWGDPSSGWDARYAPILSQRAGTPLGLSLQELPLVYWAPQPELLYLLSLLLVNCPRLMAGCRFHRALPQSGCWIWNFFSLSRVSAEFQQWWQHGWHEAA